MTACRLVFLATLAMPVVANAYNPLRPLAPEEVAVGPAAQSLTGGQLYARCTAGEGEAAACLGYLSGVIDGLEVAYDALGATQGTCVPEWLPGQPREVRRIVLAYLESQREEWDTGAGFLVADALLKAFPCPRN